MPKVVNFSTGRTFNFQEIEILDHKNNDKNRCISEMFYIKINVTVTSRTG